MTKEDYNSGFYGDRDYIVVEIPYADDANVFQKLLCDRGIHYDYRVNRENGRNVYIIFKDNMKENTKEQITKQCSQNYTTIAAFVVNSEENTSLLKDFLRGNADIPFYRITDHYEICDCVEADNNIICIEIEAKSSLGIFELLYDVKRVGINEENYDFYFISNDGCEDFFTNDINGEYFDILYALNYTLPEDVIKDSVFKCSNTLSYSGICDLIEDLEELADQKFANVESARQYFENILKERKEYDETDYHFSIHEYRKVIIENGQFVDAKA